MNTIEEYKDMLRAKIAKLEELEKESEYGVEVFESETGGKPSVACKELFEKLEKYIVKEEEEFKYDTQKNGYAKYGAYHVQCKELGQIILDYVWTAYMLPSGDLFKVRHYPGGPHTFDFVVIEELDDEEDIIDC